MIKDYNQSINKIAKNLEKQLSFMNLTYEDILKMIKMVLWDLSQKNLITEENLYNSILKGCYKIIKEQTLYDDYRYINEFVRMSTKVTSSNIKNRNCLSNILNFFKKINLELDEYVLEKLLNENSLFEDLLYSFFINTDNEKTVLKNINDSKIKNILEMYIKIRKVEEDEFLKEEDSFVMESAVDWYLNQIGKHSILTKEEEVELFNKYHQATGKKKTELKKEIASHYLKLVVTIAKRYNNKYLSFEDLINDANVGLMKAIDKYDVNSGNKFFSIAIWFVRQEITRYSYNQNRCIRIPTDIQTKLHQYLKYQEDFVKKFNRKPTDEEMASLLNVKVQHVITLEKTLQQPTSLDAPLGVPLLDESDSTSFDIVLNEASLYPQFELEKKELRVNLKQSLEKLSILEKQIILIKYGFLDGISKTLQETAINLYENGYTDHKITNERIRQLEARALKKLRGKYKKDLHEYLPESGINR